MRLSNRTASRIGWKADRVERFIALARAALAWERVWPALWPASGIVGLFLAAALSGLLGFVPGWLHLLILIGAFGGTAFLLTTAFIALRVPDWREGARRLERDSTLPNRPITERDDVLMAGRGDPWAEALWRAHVKRLLGSIRNLRVAWPSPGLPEKDPHALRFAVLLLLVTGFAIAGRDWQHRLAAAFLPSFEAGGPAATLDAWINPPGYTGEAPIYLKRHEDKVIAAPIGSKLVLRVHGADAVPRVQLAGGDGDSGGFKGQGQEYTADFALKQSGEIAVAADGRTLGRWHIRVVPDDPPVVAFSAPPTATRRNAVKFAFTAGDDYGIVKMRAIIAPVKASEKGKAKKSLIVDLPVDDPTAKTLQQTTYEDLTDNPYAGLEVTVTLEATDGAGQTGKSKAVAFTLPSRVFTNPLARALVEQRQNLALGDFTAVPKAQRTLSALTIAPERFYAGKAGVYTAIRAAYWGLRDAHVQADISRVEDLLWQTALALEDAGLADAAAQLRRLQQMLSQALMSGAPQSTIDELLQRYKQALERYMQKLAQNAQPGQNQVSPGTRTLSQKDLQDLLNAIQQMAQTGDRTRAAQALAMLQNLLENLHMQAGNGQGQQSPEDKAASDAVKKLGELMGKQRELLDKTYRQGEDAGNPKDGGGKGLAQQQGKLKDELGKVLKGLGDQKVQTPKSLGDAGRAMGEAQGELGNKDFDSAGDAQKQALEDLRKGAGEMAQNLMKHGQQGAQGANEDPFGRNEGRRGATLGNDVKIPDKSTLERAREILKELRKRAAERGRPQEELDYIDRLLKQF